MKTVCRYSYLTLLSLPVFFLCFLSACNHFRENPEDGSPEPVVTDPAKIEEDLSENNNKPVQEPIVVAEPDPIPGDDDSAPVPESGQKEPPVETPGTPYLLRVGDVLEISVLDEPEMTREVRVIPDGSITYLLVGEVPAANRTIRELREDVSRRLNEYFVDPRVSILSRKIAELQAEEIQVSYVSIIGAMKNPGKYEMSKDYRLLDLLADAGGLLFINDELGGRTVANLKAAYVSRDGNNLAVDFDRLLRMGEMENNIRLKPGDFVYVPDAETSSIIVLGEVQMPRLIPFNRDISIVEAISRCGGFTETAQRGRIVVIRTRTGMNYELDMEKLLLGQEETNLAMEAGDIVFVPEQGLSEYARYANYLSDFAELILNAYQVREAVRFPQLKRERR